MLFLERTQKILSVIMCLSTTLLVYYGVGNLPVVKDYVLACVFLYFCFDLFITSKIQMIFHHLAVCAIILDYFYFANVYPIENINYVTNILLLGEIPSIFLGMRRVIETYPQIKKSIPMLMMINDIAFMLCFLYFRTYILTLSLYDVRFFYTREPWLIRFLAILCLYCLNYIWTFEILRVFFNKLIKI